MKPIIKARPTKRLPQFQIEIVANYPKYRMKDKKGDWVTIGTFHAYLCDLDIDLRGLHYLLKKDKIYIRYPSRQGFVEGKECSYLTFSFCSEEKQKGLTASLKYALKKFTASAEFNNKVDEIRCTK